MSASSNSKNHLRLIRPMYKRKKKKKELSYTRKKRKKKEKKETIFCSWHMPETFRRLGSLRAAGPGLTSTGTKPKAPRW